MASPFSGRAGRLAGMWAAGQATKGLGDIISTLREGEQGAGGYLTGAYETGLGEMEGGYGSMLQALQQSYQNAPAELTRGRDSALAASAGGFTGGERAAYEGQDRGITSLLDAQRQAIPELRGGRDAALGYGAEAMDQTRGNYAEALARMRAGYGGAEGTLREAVGAWDPLVKANMAGFDMYGNALGLGGQAGHDAATGAFRAGPGYEWRVGEATSAAQRAANKTGQLMGGNVVDATTKLGGHLADQEYDEWVRNLSGFQAGAQNAVAGQTGARTSLAGMQAQGGQAMAGLDTAEAAAINQILKNQGDISQTAGRDIANVDMTTGKGISDLYGTTGGKVADLRAKAGTDAAGLYARTGSGLADMALNRGTAEAKLAGDYASQIAGLAGQYGGTMASLTAGTAGNVASAQQTANNQVIGAGTQGMLAGQQAATNTWGAIMGGLGIGGNLLGASLGAGSSNSLLSNLFK